MRGATHSGGITSSTSIFQSTRPMRGATQTKQNSVIMRSISIHAPHAGRDRRCHRWRAYTKHFNPRAPCGARRRCHRWRAYTKHFNPRAPCGARLFQIIIIRAVIAFQSTRPMRGATFQYLCIHNSPKISIHAPHAGRDPKAWIL